jgi:alpha-D-xyloside xylohydrolase
VAPVTDQGIEHRKVYLPAGSDWYNYWTNEKFSGGQTIDVPAPIDTIPLFVRAGSIIPMGEQIPSTATPQKLASLRVYPGKDADFTLYDDDGVSYGYERGAGKSVRLHWDEQRKKLSAGDGMDVSKLVQVMGR